MALPTPEEVAANDDLITELKAQNNFEAPAETERRYICRRGEKEGEEGADL